MKKALNLRSSKKYKFGRNGEINFQKEKILNLLMPTVDKYLNRIKPKTKPVFKIRKMSACWGNCNKSGIINLNLYLIHTPYDCIEYIIVHEICHLREFNHQKPFWDLVEKYLPNYKDAKEKLDKIDLKKLSKS